MAFDKAEKARRRAEKAGPFPKPRGRRPRGSNGVLQKWDNLRGGWLDVVAPAWSSTIEFPDLGADVTLPFDPAAPVVTAPIVAAPAVSWEAPNFWQLEESSSKCSERLSKKRTRLHECVKMTPRGSRSHTFEHISPGGTAQLDEYLSPADARATHDLRRECLSRMARARVDLTRVKCYRTACEHCGTIRLVRQDGCMQHHSIGPSLNARERAEYMKRGAYVKHGWECPGSHVYLGPRREESDESAESDESDE